MAPGSPEQNITPSQNTPYFEKLSSLNKFVRENLPRTQVLFGENNIDMVNSCESAEDALTFLLEQDETKEIVLNLKEIVIFAHSTGYDSVNKILNIAPGASPTEIKEVLIVGEESKKVRGVEADLMEELYKTGVPPVEDPVRIVPLDDNELPEVAPISIEKSLIIKFEGSGEDGAIKVLPGYRVTIGRNKGETVSGVVNQAYRNLTDEEKNILQNSNVKVSIDYIGDNQREPYFDESNKVVRIGTNSTEAGILNTFKFAINKLTPVEEPQPTPEPAPEAIPALVLPTTPESEPDQSAELERKKERLSEVSKRAYDRLTKEEQAIVDADVYLAVDYREEGKFEASFWEKDAYGNNNAVYMGLESTEEDILNTLKTAVAKIKEINLTQSQPEPVPIPDPTVVVPPAGAVIDIAPQSVQDPVVPDPVVEKQGVNGKTFEQMIAEIDMLQRNNDDYVKNKGWRQITGVIGNFAKRTMETETARGILASKVVQGYMGLSRGQKMAISLTLGTAAGFALGSAASIGVASYGVARLARVGASFGGSTAGTIIGEKKESWKEDFVKGKEDEEIANIKQFGFTREKEAEELAKIEKRYERERKNIRLKKMALTVGMGAGAGMMEGLSEHVFHYGGGAGKVAEAVNNKPKLDQSLGGARPAGVKDALLDGKPAGMTSRGVEMAERTSKINPDGISSDRISPLESEGVVDNLNKVSLDPESLVVTPKVGDGLWNVLKQPLNDNPQFVKLNSAQQQNVLAYYTNKGISDPEKFGLVKDAKFGVHVDAGKEVDLSKLVGDPEELQRVIAKAGKLSAKAQADILANSKRIAEYASSHEGTAMTMDKVAEAVSVDPVNPMDIKLPEMVIEPPVIPGAGSPNMDFDPSKYEFQRPPAVADPNVVLDQSIKYAGLKTGAMASIGMANVAMASAINRPRSMMNDAENQKQVKIGVEQGVNDVYGQDKFFLKTAGVDTKEWGLMKGLNAKQVLQYMKHDSLDVGLKPEIIENLKSNNHMKFLGELDNLMKLTKINQALPDEKVEGLLARLVKGALKVQADKIVLK